MTQSIYTNQVRAKIAALQTEFDAITRNPELSPEGQRRAVERTREAFQTARAEALDKLKFEWTAIKREYKNLKMQLEAAQDDAARDWDYSRLAYERDRARQAITQAISLHGPGAAPAELQKTYDQLSNSGDRYALRAWAEHGPGILHEQYRGEDRGKVRELTQRMQADIEKLTVTPKIAATAAATNELTKRAVEAERATRQAAEFYDRNNWGTSEFYKLAEGVTLTQQMRPEQMDVVTHLEVEV